MERQATHLSFIEKQTIYRLFGIPEGFIFNIGVIVVTIFVLLPDAADDLIEFLMNASYEAKKDKRKCRKTTESPE